MADRPFSPFRRLPGTSRRYEEYDPLTDKPTGRVLSRRQYDAEQELFGYRTQLTGEQLRKQREAQRKYQATVSRYVSEQRQKGNIIGVREARTKSKAEIRAELKKVDQTWRDLDAVVGYHQKGKLKGRPILFKDTAEGRRVLRDQLENLGRRRGIPSWVPPGLSDKYRAGKLKPSRVPKKFAMA